MPSGTELSAVIFGQHVHAILILVTFLRGSLKDKVDNSNIRTEEEQKYIRKEMANIPAELLR
jgi:hypothetical protein